MSEIIIEGNAISKETVETPTTDTDKQPELTELEKKLLSEVEVNGQEVVLLNDSVVVKGLGGMSKTIAYEDFIQAISKATNTLSKESKLAVAIPTSTFYLAIGPSEIDISCYYNEGIKPFQYWDGNKTHKFNIVVPNIIISFKLRKERDDWVVVMANYLVTDQPVSRLPLDRLLIGVDKVRRLHLMPFTNSYNNCTMCYGGNKMPARFTAGNLRGLDYYYNFLWESPFNNDLGISDKVNRDKFPDARTWYYHLRDLATDNKPFPYAMLRW